MKLYILNACQLSSADLDYVLRHFDTMIYSLGRQISHDVERVIMTRSCHYCLPHNTLVITPKPWDFIGYSTLSPYCRNNEYDFIPEFLDNICIPVPPGANFYIVDETESLYDPYGHEKLILEVCSAIKHSPKSNISFGQEVDFTGFKVVSQFEVPHDSDTGNTVYVSNGCYASNRDRGYSTVVRQGVNAVRGTNFTEEFIQNVSDHLNRRSHPTDSTPPTTRHPAERDRLPPAFKEDCITLNFSSNINGTERIQGVRFVISFSLSKEPKDVVLEKLKEILDSYNYVGVKNVIIDEDTPDDIIAFFVRRGLSIVINKPVVPPETAYTLPVKLSIESGLPLRLTISTEYTEDFSVDTSVVEVADISTLFYGALSERLVVGFRSLILNDLQKLIDSINSAPREEALRVETPILVTGWFLLIERGATFI